jgi:acylphosphatase
MADDPAQSPHCVHLTISGRVQGVGYRAWLHREATARGIAGWARNRLHGDVEAVLAGAPEAVKALCDVCFSGPPAARVDRILIDEADPAALEAMGAATAFVVLPTA